ncbi:hypothetical protein RHSIM_Rhsim11G0095000 [Rhododendron simsii]|uniref:Uncharacterized protein n=1 Tax=Rhododendron simsii TaxID=118357 RepID=A0A834G8S8_RHOSS|nr:hypothetical protein RHSIM_Rhsim11G0095000 [Rhododendron simsii]
MSMKLQGWLCCKDEAPYQNGSRRSLGDGRRTVTCKDGPPLLIGARCLLSIDRLVFNTLLLHQRILINRYVFPSVVDFEGQNLIAWVIISLGKNAAGLQFSADEAIFAVSVPSKRFLLAAKCARCRDTENESQDLVLGNIRSDTSNPHKGLPYFGQIAVDFVCLVADAADLKHHEKPSIQAVFAFGSVLG